MPRYKIHHRTKYTYTSLARESANRIILFPQADDFQEVIKHELKITDEPVVYTHTDYFGNTCGNFNVNVPHSAMIIDSLLTVQTNERPVPADDVNAKDQWSELLLMAKQHSFIEYLRQENFSGTIEITAMTEKIKCANCTPYQLILQLNEWVFTTFKYIKGITNVESSIEEIWKLKAGVCQDFAHVLSCILRMVGIPARYVSGYICPHDNDLRGIGATHAWVEAYIPFFGWLGIDPTNNCTANDKHVRIAVGRNYNDCSPVKGVYKGSQEHHLDVLVSVQFEDGHITKGISETDFAGTAEQSQPRYRMASQQ
jgi:transglutaminase-like putative cysteine protease